MKKKTKLEMVTELSVDLDISIREANLFVNTFINLIKREVINGNKVCFSKFGSFNPGIQKASKRRNLVTNEPMDVPEKKNVKFKPAQKFKDEINK